jgi:hypothetical protein
MSQTVWCGRRVSRHDAYSRVRAFRISCNATHARLRRVNETPSRWDEHEAAPELFEDIRPQVNPPTLSRAALKQLQRMWVEVIGEQEELWERRN